jgi:steroid delta-isomerase-like uncharacterized protein
MIAPKQTVVEWIAAFNKHDVATIAALYYEDATNIQIPAVAEPVRGRQSMINVFTGLFRAFPDCSAEVDHLFEDGEWAILEWSLRGTLCGEFAGHPPNGRGFILRGSEFFQVTNGEIQLQRGYWDKATWFKQLALPIDE